MNLTYTAEDIKIISSFIHYNEVFTKYCHELAKRCHNILLMSGIFKPAKQTELVNNVASKINDTDATETKTSQAENTAKKHANKWQLKRWIRW